MGTRIYVVKLPLLKKGKKEIQHLLSTCSCAMSFSPFSLLTRPPRNAVCASVIWQQHDMQITGGRWDGEF